MGTFVGQTTVVIYEPLSSICGAYEAVLRSCTQLRLLGVTTEAREATELAAQQQPQVFVMSAYGTSTDEDLSLLRQLKAAAARAVVLVLQTDEGSDFDICASEFINAGADKVLSKRSSIELLFAELQAAVNGG